MLILRLYLEFFRAGLFAVGGGLATIPFLQDMSVRTGWFTAGELTTMIAVSESTPGPIGVNMATYVGFQTAGVPGAVIATLGLVSPSVIIILIVAGFLKKFRSSRTVDDVFRGLRPASMGLILCASLTVAKAALLTAGVPLPGAIRWKSVVLTLAVFALLFNKKIKKLHPIVLIAISAVIGVIFRF